MLIQTNQGRMFRMAVVLAISVAGLALAPVPAQAASPYVAWPNSFPTNDSFFPLAVWLQSPGNAQNFKALGINTYVGLWDGPTESQLSTLAAAGIHVVCNQNTTGLSSGNKGIIKSWMHGDEPDNAQPDGSGGYGPPILPSVIVADYVAITNLNSSRPVLLNLGMGVAWDGWYGRGVRTNHPEDYPEYVKGCDIASFDIYPVTSTDDAVRGNLWYVGYGTERLVNWTGGQKPVWTCIEASHVSSTILPTPAQMRSEVWMALINGSRGIIYFVHEWYPSFSEPGVFRYPELMDAMTSINAQVTNLAAVLNSPTVTNATTVSSSNPGVPVQTMLKRHGGATYLFAVSMRNTNTTGNFTVAGLSGSMTAEVLGESRTRAVSDGSFNDAFTGYAVHLYRIDDPSNQVAAPTFTPGSGSFTTTQMVTISSATAGADIRYTADGTLPTATTGTVYGTALTITNTTTMKAIAYKAGMSNSTVASATYTKVILDTNAPSIPTVLSATAVSWSGIDLAWTSSTDNVAVTGYRIYRDSVQVATSPTNSYTDSSLSASTLYSYRVSAYDGAGNTSAPSVSASATTLAAPAFALDASTPAAVKGNAVTLTTASFTPPAGSVLYIAIGSQQAITGITDNRGTHLTYTLQATYGNSGGGDAMTTLYTASVPTSQVMTISATQASGQYAMMNVLVIAGANIATPVGAKGGGRGVTGVVSDTYTSTSAGSLCWLLYADWTQKSIPTAGANQIVYDSYTVAGEDTYAIICRTNATPTVGASVTMNTIAPTTGAQISYLYFEMRPSGGAPVNQPPAIDTAASANPNPVALPAGVAVRVVASDPDGDSLTYAWSKVSGPGTVTFAASSAADSGVTFSEPGSYVLRVTVDDGRGGTATSEVTVVVNEPELRLTGFSCNPAVANEFIIRWQSASNHRYTLQAATNLLSGFTLNLRTNILAIPPENVHTDNVQGVGMKFYRVVEETGTGAGTNDLFGWQLTATNIGLRGAGVNPQTLAAYTGPSLIPSGTTVSDRRFTTRPDLSAGNITLERCWIDIGAGGGALITASPNGPITLLDCDIEADDAPIADGNYNTVAYAFAISSGSGDALLTVKRCNIHGMGGGAWIDGPALFENTIIHGLRGIGNPGTTGNHVDGFTRRSGTNQLTIRNCRIDSTTPGNTTGDLFLQTTWGSYIDNMLITGNLFVYRGNNLILEAKDGGSYGNHKYVVNNRFVGGYYCQNFMVPSSPPRWDTWTDNFVYSATDPDGRGAVASAP